MDPGSPATLRCLVLCSTCRRQYDATGLSAKSRFRCACGRVVEVPRFAAQDAAVVRCSACGAPRERAASSCAHCGADFTLRETDMQTLCPACMARISDRSRFCHHCATPIVPAENAGRPTRQACPACGPRQRLNGRELGEPQTSVLECPGCAGLWLVRAVFVHLAERARDLTVPEALIPPDPVARSASAPVVGRSLYRPCPECGALMHRRNFAQHSGVVIDTCREHGSWFDAEELGAVLRFIREGGEARASERQQTERRHAERQERIKVERKDRAAGHGGAVFPEDELEPDLLGLLVRSLFGGR